MVGLVRNRSFKRKKDRELEGRTFMSPSHEQAFYEPSQPFGDTTRRYEVSSDKHPLSW